MNERTPTQRPWSVRYCNTCRQWERDAGAPMGYVPFRRERETPVRTSRPARVPATSYELVAA